MKAKNVRVMIVGDAAASQSRLGGLLSANPRWKVCSEIKNGKDASEGVLKLKPDLAVFDMSNKIANATEIAREISEIAPATKILFFSKYVDGKGSSE